MWRYSASRVGILYMDAACLLPAAFAIVYWPWWKAALCGVAFFAVLGVWGVSMTAVARRIRCWWVGRRRDGTTSDKRGFYA